MAEAVRRLALLLALLAAAALGACGGGGAAGGEEPAGETPRAVPWLDPEGDEPVVGSLAINPADGRLWLATNTGLFRVPERGRPERVTGTLATPDGRGQISEQLVVRFTGPDELLGSGHPRAGETGLPPVLGLIRSQDGGRSWTSVSELGTADFHTLERSGELLAGAQSGQSLVLASHDDGRTWESRTAPGVIVDLEVDPGDAARWIVSTADGIFVSRDEGGTWRQVDYKPHVRFAWAAPDALYRIDPGGPVKLSRDGGFKWEDLGSTGGEPRALAAADRRTLYAALLDGTVKRSTDGGSTWTTFPAPPR